MGVVTMGSGWRRTAAAMALVLVAAGCAGRVSEPETATETGGATDEGVDLGGDSVKGKRIKKGGSKTKGAATESGPTTLPEKIPTARSAQIAAPPTANVCGRNGIIDTGKAVQFPWAVQCLKEFTGDNGGEVYRGVYRDRIRVAYYISRDPVTVGATRAAGGCPDPDCVRDYVNTYVKWFEKYYQTYGRKLEVVFIEGSGADSDERAARDDARRIAGIDPPVFASINGPGQAGGVYAEELKAEGIVCFCTVSLPQEFYKKNFPFVFSTLMSSTQAYIHRAEYIGKRLAHRKAQFAGDDLLRQRGRSFGLVYFDNTRGDYRSGVAFFQKQLAKYNVRLKKIIAYTNIEGCQIDATNIVNQLQLANVTSVIFSGDPVCPIHLTRAAEQQNAKWEWIVTGSALTDTNNFGRLYQQDQWKRAFGVSMLQPDVKNENDYWYKMYEEIRGDSGEAQENAPVVLAPIILFYTGVHLTGPAVTPKNFAVGMARAIKTGGTVTLPKRSYGPKRVAGISFFDTTSYDDMTEIWWDPDQQDPNGRTGTYWYARGGRRYDWGDWPKAAAYAFTKKGAVFGYDNPPDQ
jgi:hypothetical protein